MDSEKEVYYGLNVFIDVRDFIKELSKHDRAKVLASIVMMQKGQFGSARIKSLRGKIKELIIKNYRFIFFIHNNIIYFIGAFIKKTKKTPVQEIYKAEKIYFEFIKYK